MTPPPGNQEEADNGALVKDFLVKNGKCVTCESKVPSNSLIECNQCCDRFHAVCSSANRQNKICNETLLKSYSQNSTKNNFMWMCNSCLTLYEHDKNCGISDKLNSMLLKFEMMNNTINELRAEVANNTKSISDISVKNVEGSQNPCNTASSHHASSSSGHSNVGTAWEKPPNIVQSTKQRHEEKSRDDNSRREKVIREKKAKTSLLIKCDEEGDTPSLADIRQIAVTNGIPITQVRVTANKNTVITVPNEDVLNKLKPLLNASPLNKYDVANVRDKLPRISVLDLDEEYDEQNFINTLKLQNQDVASILDTGENISEFYIKKNQSTFQVNITVSENIRKAIKNRGNRLFIGLKSCRVVEKVNVSRCYKCHDHSHISNDCNNIECCGYCSSTDHVSDDCPLKSDVIKNKSRLKCVNCERNNLPCFGHSVYWPLCPMNKKYYRTPQGQSGQNQRLN